MSRSSEPVGHPAPSRPRLDVLGVGRDDLLARASRASASARSASSFVGAGEQGEGAGGDARLRREVGDGGGSHGYQRRVAGADGIQASQTTAQVRWKDGGVTTILSIQSSVAYGHVGNSAAVFPLQRLGVEVWPVNTVHFSNHTGYGAWRGPLLPADDVREVITGIEERGALPAIDAVLSGYQGGEEIGDVILDAVARVKAANPAGHLRVRPGHGQREVGLLRPPRHPGAAARARGAAGRPHHAQPVRARLPHRDRAGVPRGHAGVGGEGPRDGPVDGARDLGAAARPARGHDRDAGRPRRRGVDRADPAAADEGQRVRRRDRRRCSPRTCSTAATRVWRSDGPCRASSTCSS